MPVKRKTTKLRQGDIIDVEEYHDGNYGAPGQKRQKKKKPTKEDIRKNNASQKARRARLRLLQYFGPGDCFATWTYEKSRRPEDMQAALKDFQKAIRKVREDYKKRGYELFWIRNIERSVPPGAGVSPGPRRVGGRTAALSQGAGGLGRPSGRLEGVSGCAGPAVPPGPA